MDHAAQHPPTREAQIVTASWVRDAREDHVDDDEKKSGFRWWWLVGLAVLALGFGVQTVLKSIGGPPESAGASDTLPLVETVAAAAEGRSYTVEEDGFLRPRAEVDVVAELAGRIERLSPKLVPGGRFEAGEVLFTLDAREARAQESQARADLASARAQLSQAQADNSRQQRLAEIGATAQSQAEQSAASLASAQARLAQAEAQLEIASERLEDTAVEAPFPATVMTENAAEGAYVSPGQVVARLFDNSEAEIPLGLAPADAAAVRRAQKASDGPLTVRVEPTGASASTRVLYGEVSQIAGSLDAQARTVQVTIRVDDAFDPAGEGEVYAQDFVRVLLPALSERSLYAAPSGVLRKDGYVWQVVDQDGQTVLSRVEVEPVRFEADRVIFATDADLDGARLASTALTEEAEGMAVRVGEGEPSARNQNRGSPSSGPGTSGAAGR